VGPGGKGVYLDFKESTARLGAATIKERYGNLFEMYERITGEDGYKAPMRIYPASHYTMGGLWVDYNLMSNIPGLFVLGEANFSVHGANRLGASALMQGLADGYFVIPYTLADYLARIKPVNAPGDHAECRKSVEDVKGRITKLLSIGGRETPAYFMRKLGKVMWDNAGMARSRESLSEALRKIPEIREEFWRNVKVAGSGSEVNQQLENAGRTADFIEFAGLLCRDALERDESCGAHFRVEHQHEDGEAKRDDDKYSHVSAWGFRGDGAAPELHTEPLTFTLIKPAVRSYK
jgi:succinate dehydrogenase / fumarate reductase flavoprotein subunit